MNETEEERKEILPLELVAAGFSPASFSTFQLFVSDVNPNSQLVYATFHVFRSTIDN
jgi:hypothetical protein